MADVVLSTGLSPSRRETHLVCANISEVNRAIHPPVHPSDSQMSRSRRVNRKKIAKESSHTATDSCTALGICVNFSRIRRIICVLLQAKERFTARLVIGTMIEVVFTAPPSANRSSHYIQRLRKRGLVTSVGFCSAAPAVLKSLPYIEVALVGCPWPAR